MHLGTLRVQLFEKFLFFTKCDNHQISMKIGRLKFQGGTIGLSLENRKIQSGKFGNTPNREIPGALGPIYPKCTNYKIRKNGRNHYLHRQQNSHFGPSHKVIGLHALRWRNLRAPGRAYSHALLLQCQRW